MPSQFNTVARPSAAEIGIQLKLLKSKKEELAILNKKNAADKNVEELKKKFDLERIGLTAALNAATDEETKLRLRSQLAILDNNEALAKKLLAEMNGAKAADDLTTALYAVAGAAMDSALKFRQINPLAGTMYGETGRGGFPTTGYSSTSFPSIAPDFYSGQTQVTNPFAGTYYGETGRDPMPISITIDTSQTGDRFSQLIAESIQVANRSGYSTSANGQLP
jgi:hypothetical protein